jgi:hypothetical protein
VTAALLFELAFLFRKEAEGIADAYAWPPRTLTDDELREVNRLSVTASSLRYRGAVAAYEEQSCPRR